MAIILYFLIIILKDKIIFDSESISIDVIPIDKPLLEIVVAASNTINL